MSSEGINENVRKYFEDKIQELETEKEQLKEDLVKLTSPDSKFPLDYYLSLKSDLLKEISELQKNKEYNDKNSQIMIDKLNKDIEILSNQNFQLEKEKIELKNEVDKLKNDLKAKEDIIEKYAGMQKIQEGKSSVRIERRQNTISTSERTIDAVKNKDKIKQAPAFSSVLTAKNPAIQSTLSKNASKVGSYSSKQNLGFAAQKEANYSSKGDDYEYPDFDDEINNITDLNDAIDRLCNYSEQNKQLKEDLNKKNYQIKDLQEKLQNFNDEKAKEFEKIQSESAGWKDRFMTVATANKTIAEEHETLFNKRIENYKKEKDGQFYSQDKKITFLETELTKKERELDYCLESNNESTKNKDKEVSNMTSELSNLEANFQLMYTLYTDHLSRYNENLAKLKELFIARGKEFTNITKYYVDCVNDYSKPLKTGEDHVGFMEESLKTSSEKIHELEEALDSRTVELNKVTEENINLVPHLRKKINSTLKKYEDRMDEIIETHKKLTEKLANLTGFTEKFENKLKLFNKILEDNKKLIEKNNSLEAQLKISNNAEKIKEELNQKEKIFNLQKEVECKEKLISEYEQTINQVEEKIKNGFKGQVGTDQSTIFRLNTQVSKLNNEVILLEKTKEGFEEFYKKQINDLIELIKKVNEKAEQEKTKVTRQQNDELGATETFINLFTTEFKEFKDAIGGLEDIVTATGNFKVEADELLKLKQNLCNEELSLARKEMAEKGNQEEKLNSAHQQEVNRYKEQVDRMKKSVSEQLQNLKLLNQKKQEEIDALTKEKILLKEFDERRTTLLNDTEKLLQKEKADFEKICKDQFDMKECVVYKLKEDISRLEEKIQEITDKNARDIEELSFSMNEQLRIIQERESLCKSELERITKEYAAFKEEKEMAMNVMNMELEKLKNANYLLNHVKESDDKGKTMKKTTKKK